MATVQGDIMVGSVKNIVDRLSKDFSTSKPPLSIHEPRKSLFSKPASPQVVAIFSYKACQDDELTLSLGDIIEVLEEVEDGWSKGKNVKTGEVGMFPTNFVENKVSLTPTNSTIPVLREERHTEPEAIKRTPSVIGVPLPSMTMPSTTTTTTFPAKKENEETKTKEMAKVKFIYEPQHPDELKLGEIGALIQIVRKDCGDPGWFEGELNGKVGLFPDNFVELVQVPVSYTSGSPKPSMKQEAAKVTTKAPILAPSGSVAIPPAVPAKPKPKLTDSNQSLNSIPSTTAPSVPSVAKPVGSSNFTDIRNRLAAGLKVVAPGDPVPSALSKSTIVSGSSGLDSDVVQRPMSTVEVCSSDMDQPTQLNHVTKDRPRAPGKRPMSMLMTKKKGSTGNLLESPTNDVPSIFSSSLNTSSSVHSIPAASSEAPHTAPVSASPTRFTAMKPLKEEQKEEIKVFSSGDSGSHVKVRAQAFQLPPTAPSKISPVSSSVESDTVSRKEFNDLLARFNILEARLAALENSTR